MNTVDKRQMLYQRFVKDMYLNQLFHKAKLALKWWAEDMQTLTEKTEKAALSMRSFAEAYKQVNRR